MVFAIRSISLLQRKWHSARECRRIVARFNVTKDEIRDQLPNPRPIANKLLIIRLDDIGDYILFRNHLRMYKSSPRWRGHSITLLANTSWKSLFDKFDADAVDDIIWVNKNQYLECSAYRFDVWRQLRESGFGTVIAPSRTRPLVLDDACMLAAAPIHAIGSANTYVHAIWNQLSDDLYDELLRSANIWTHEFHFNAEFAVWCCGSRYGGSRPQVDADFNVMPCSPYIVCFLGANTRSKRWPARRWIEFINLYEKYHSHAVLLAGQSDAELEMAHSIQRRTNSRSIAGATSLPGLLRWIAGARALITNDTMAAHLGVSCNLPTVIVANGVNYTRFTEYERAGISNVVTVYPKAFMRTRERSGDIAYDYTRAVSADMASIGGATVFHAMERLVDASETAVVENRQERESAQVRAGAM